MCTVIWKPGGHCQGKGRLHRRGIILTILNSFYQAEELGQDIPERGNSMGKCPGK